MLYGKIKALVEYGVKCGLIETDDAIYAFNVPVIFITKALSTKTDVEEALALRWKGETIVGYFTLANDIDCQGVAMYSENFVDWDDNHGFRGTFDGKGFAFLNYATTVGGISVQMGKGSVVKNVSFDVTNHVNEYFCVVSRESSTTVFENITVRLLNVKAKFVTGLMTGASKTCHYKDIIIDGAGLSLTHIFGYTNSSTSTYENVVINAESVEYYYESVATAPEGVTFNKKEA